MAELKHRKSYFLFASFVLLASLHALLLAPSLHAQHIAHRRVVIDAAATLSKAPDGKPLSAAQGGSPAVVAHSASQAFFSGIRSGEEVLVTNFPLPNGSRVNLLVRHFDVFTPDAVVSERRNDRDIRRPIPDIKCFRGVIEGTAGSFVFLAVKSSSISGTVQTQNAVYHLGTEDSPSVQSNNAVMHVYQADPFASGFTCGVTDEDEMRDFESDIDINARPATTDTLLAKIALDADFEAYNHYGSVQATEDYMVARFGEVSAIFERDATVRLQLSRLRVWAQADPYQGIDFALLDSFMQYWRANELAVDRAVATLITLKPLQSFAGVAASTNGLCNKYIGFSLIGFNRHFGVKHHVQTLGHELGHNFGAFHTHSCLWKPAIDSCYTAEDHNGTPCFPAGEERLPFNGGELMSYCHLKHGIDNIHLEFRERVRARIRTKAEAASCITAITSVGIDEAPQAATLNLHQNYPNPVSIAAEKEIAIEFDLASRQQVRLAIYNALGQEVQAAVDEIRPAGAHTVTVSTAALTPGVYFYRLSSTSDAVTKVFHVLP